MFDEWSLPLRFFIAFIVVLGLIGLTAWVVRRFSGDRLGTSNTRGRQPRLAVIDAAAVDGRRRLILIRRDNVEHLLMIGGPSDVVVEPNIVRAAAGARESAPAPRAAAPTDTLPRPVPLGEGTMWPLQPEPAPPVPAPRPQRAAPAPPHPVAEESWHAEPELPPVPPPQPRQLRPQPVEARRTVDPLAGLAAELARAPELARAAEPPPPAAPRVPPRTRERLPMREPVRDEIAREPKAPGADQQQAQEAAEQNLAEMAQRLEAALRRPARKEEPRAAAELQKAASGAQPEEPAFDAEALARTPQQAQAPEPKVQRPEPRPVGAGNKPGKSPYDSLEQEMASLLGRPNKT